MNRNQLSVVTEQEPAEPPGYESVKWLALVLAEMFRVGLALIAKRYPEARGAMTCSRCGHRQQ